MKSEQIYESSKIVKLARLILHSCMLLICCIDVTAQCTTAGPNNPATFSNNASVGVRSWSNASNSQTSDNSYATSSALILGQKTNYLCASNFGFSIGSTYTICGIEVQIEKSFTGLLGNITDFDVRIIKGGALTGNNLAETAAWTSTDKYSVYGSSSEVWGTTWSPSDINASGFGVAISANLGGVLALPVARIDHILVKVYYQEPLPVDLISFDASCTNSGIELNWICATETSNDHFEIWRSADAVQWMKLDDISGAGTTSIMTHYSYLDKNPLPGIVYYRLMQWDVNNQCEALPVIAIRNDCTDPSYQLFIYPNPSSGRINIKYHSPFGGEILIVVSDSFGAVRRKLKLNSRSGQNNYTINADWPHSGEYELLTIFSNNASVTAKVIFR